MNKRSQQVYIRKLTTFEVLLWLLFTPVILYPLAMVLAASLKEATTLMGSFVELILWVYPLIILALAGIIFLVAKKNKKALAYVLLVSSYLLIITFAVKAFNYIF